MRQIGADEIENIRRDCAIALSGADYVRDRLVSLSTIGPSSLASSTYAIKCRVKSEERLLNKVIHRRSVKNNPDYSAFKVKDIVGFRLICIYSESLIEVTRHFLDFVQVCQNDRIGLFAGKDLDAAIEEIIVYSSPQASYAYDAVYSELSNFGIRQVKISRKEATRDEPYSSIHIVCQCISHHASKPKPIPVEVQIRTIFEDAWAEVDHPLRYKGFHYRQIVSGEQVNESVEALYEKAKDTVVGLKSLFDATSTQVANARGAYQVIEQHFRPATTERGPYAFAGVNFRYKMPEAFALQPIASLERGIAKVEKELDQFYALLSSANFERLPLLQSKATSILKDFQRLSDQYQRQDEASWKSDRRFSYYSQLEQALIYVWRFRISTLMGGLPAISAPGDLEAAIAIYRRFIHDSQNELDALIPFRLANAIQFKRTSTELPLELMHEANRRLPKDPKGRADTILAVFIPRQIALFSWTKVQELRKERSRFGFSGNMSLAERKAITDALDATQEADRRLDRLIQSGVLAGKEATVQAEKSANNFISYLWEYSVQIGGLDARAREAIKSGRIEKFIEIFGSNVDDWTKNAVRLDSLVKAHHLLGHDEARRIADLLKICADGANTLSQVDRDAISFTLHTVENMQAFQCFNGVEDAAS